MKPLVSLLFATTLTFFVPPEDSRNKYTPDDNTHFAMPTYSSLEEWQARRAHLQTQVLTAAGLSPLPPKSPLNPISYGSVERDDYSVDKILIETFPGYYLGGNLYQPIH